jgi:hypothetical protein
MFSAGERGLFLELSAYPGPPVTQSELRQAAFVACDESIYVNHRPHFERYVAHGCAIGESVWNWGMYDREPIPPYDSAADFVMIDHTFSGFESIGEFVDSDAMNARFCDVPRIDQTQQGLAALWNPLYVDDDDRVCLDRTSADTVAGALRAARIPYDAVALLPRVKFPDVDLLVEFAGMLRARTSVAIGIISTFEDERFVLAFDFSARWRTLPLTPLVP